MPHLIVEYSANLVPELNIDGLVAALHETAAGIDALPLANIRTRAERRDVYRVADCHPDNAFVAVYLRVLEGRPLDVRQSAGEVLFARLKTFVAPLLETRPMALSFEVQEIKQDTRLAHSNIQDYLTQRETESAED